MISKKEQLFEIEKVRGSLSYFLRYVKIQEPGELSLEYQMWPHLEDFFQQIAKHQLIDLIKAKQIGISWALAAYALWRIYNRPAWEVLEISKGQVEAQALLSKSKIIYDNLPVWLQIYTLEPNSTERFGFKEMGSQIITFPSTEAAGIGHTAGDVIHDESDFHEFFEINLSHTRATVADNPERHLISVSTVDKTKPSSYFKGHWKRGEGSGFPEEGQNGFKSLFYGVFSRPNRDQAFYDALVRENETTPWVVQANYPKTAEEALSPQAAQSCFNKDRLDKLWYNVSEGEIRQGFIHILCPPRVGTQYVGGIDVGEGVGLDYSCLTIIGKQGLQSEVAAVIYTNKVGTAEFAYDSFELCNEYYKPLLCVDNIGIGRAVIDKLKELGYSNLYYSDAEKKKTDPKSRKAGWSLNHPNKRELVVKLVESINDGSLITRFRPQVKELMEYQWINDYPEPTGKTHGDTIIALMMANRMQKEVGTPRKAKMFVDGVNIWA